MLRIGGCRQKAVYFRNESGVFCRVKAKKALVANIGRCSAWIFRNNAVIDALGLLFIAGAPPSGGKNSQGIRAGSGGQILLNPLPHLGDSTKVSGVIAEAEGGEDCLGLHRRVLCAGCGFVEKLEGFGS